MAFNTTALLTVDHSGLSTNNIDTSKIVSLENALIEHFLTFKSNNVKNVALFIKLHGVKGTNSLFTTLEKEKTISDTEIIEAVNYGRTLCGLNICGVLHICYGYTYTNLVNCFNMCISTNKHSLGHNFIVDNALEDFICANKSSSVDEFNSSFNNMLFNVFTTIVTSMYNAWSAPNAFSSINEEDDYNVAGWQLSENKSHIDISKFIYMWNCFISDTNLDEKFIHSLLLNYRFNTHNLIKKFIHTNMESEFKDFVYRIIKFNDYFNIVIQNLTKSFKNTNVQEQFIQLLKANNLSADDLLEMTFNSHIELQDFIFSLTTFETRFIK